MRVIPLVVFLSVAVLLPKVGSAQAYMLPTSPPDASAANASWQINGEPVFYEGDFYYPSAPTVYFDGNVMRRSGMYRGIPLYVCGSCAISRGASEADLAGKNARFISPMELAQLTADATHVLAF